MVIKFLVKFFSLFWLLLSFSDLKFAERGGGYESGLSPGYSEVKTLMPGSRCTIVAVLDDRWIMVGRVSHRRSKTVVVVLTMRWEQR